MIEEPINAGFVRRGAIIKHPDLDDAEVVRDVINDPQSDPDNPTIIIYMANGFSYREFLDTQLSHVIDEENGRVLRKVLPDWNLASGG